MKNILGTDKKSDPLDSFLVSMGIKEAPPPPAAETGFVDAFKTFANNISGKPSPPPPKAPPPPPPSGVMYHVANITDKIPYIGRKLPPTDPNQRQEGAMKALVLLTCLGGYNFMDQIVGSAVKVLFQDDLGLTDAQSSYPVTALVMHC